MDDDYKNVLYLTMMNVSVLKEKFPEVMKRLLVRLEVDAAYEAEKNSVLATEYAEDFCALAEMLFYVSNIFNGLVKPDEVDVYEASIKSDISGGGGGIVN